MTEKQRKFCENYVKTGNATQSAIAAGYSENSARSTASDLLHDDDILEHLAELTGVYRDTTLIAELVRFFYETMRDKETPLVLRIKAAEMLSKRCGVWENVCRETEAANSVIRGMVDDEMLANIEAKARENQNNQT